MNKCLFNMCPVWQVEVVLNKPSTNVQWTFTHSASASWLYYDGNEVILTALITVIGGTSKSQAEPFRESKPLDNSISHMIRTPYIFGQFECIFFFIFQTFYRLMGIVNFRFLSNLFNTSVWKGASFFLRNQLWMIQSGKEKKNPPGVCCYR